MPDRISWFALFNLLTILLLIAGGNALAPGRIQFAQPAYYTTEDFGVAYITVQRHLGADGRAAVYVSTSKSGGSAIIGKDFQPIFNHSLVWHDGDDLEKELYVKVLNDGTPEETAKVFTLFLHDAVGATLNDARAQTSITLVPPSNLYAGSFRFLNATTTVYESSQSAVQIPVVWENGTTSAARARFQVICGSACFPSDFIVKAPQDTDIIKWERSSGSASAAVTQYISLSILDDGVYEQPETFTIRLLPAEQVESDIAGVGTIGSIGEVVVTIAGPNNVNSGFLQFEADCFPDCPSRKYQLENGGVARVVVQRRGGSDTSAAVTIRTRDESAVAGVDYRAVNAVVEWANGDLSDKVVLVEALSDVYRRSNSRFYLELSDNVSAPLGGSHASTTYIDLVAPTSMFRGVVDFIAPVELEAVLKHPDESFIPLLTRTTSRLDLCPRLMIQKPGDVKISLRRHFGMLDESAAVILQTVEGTALAGVDFQPLSADGLMTVQWKGGDTTDKSIVVTILEASELYVQPRSFWLEIIEFTNVGLGDCNSLEIVLDDIAEVPRVANFDLDMDTGKLSLTLTASVIAQSLDASKLQLQSQSTSQAPSMQVFSFSKATTTASLDGMDIILNIGRSDLNALKIISGLAKNPATTFLSIQSGAFQYIVDGCVVGVGPESCSPPADIAPIPRTSAIPVQTFTADTSKPVLVGFSLDLPRRLVKLRFSEPVDASTVNVKSLTLSDTAIGANWYTLKDSSTMVFTPDPDPLSGALLFDGNRLPADGTYITLLLGATDAAAIAEVGNGQVGVLATSTFLSITSVFVVDYADPPNAVIPIGQSMPPVFLQVSPADCSPCTAGTYLVSSCSDLKDRVCATCSVCPTNSFASTACSPTSDTLCYPCTECRGGQYASVQCTTTTDRVCSSCTKCTSDEYEAFPCYNGIDRVCRTCNSCTLTKDQEKLCLGSLKWQRLQARSPYSCPKSDQQYKTLEARLQDEKSNRCGAGRCSCSGGGIGNANANGDSFPDDRRCTGPEAYNIFM